MPVIAHASLRKLAGYVLASAGARGQGFLSFDLLPELVKVVCGNEPSDSRPARWGREEKPTHFPARKALATFGNVAELSGGHDKPSYMS